MRRVGEFEAGAIELIGYDDTTGADTSHLFDHQGNVVVSSLFANGDTWTYQRSSPAGSGQDVENRAPAPLVW